MGRAEIAAMGVGGLLNEIPTRPQPRDERPAEPPRAPKIAQSCWRPACPRAWDRTNCSKMSRGKPMIRHAVEAALASHADRVIVVTGHAAADRCEVALRACTSTFANNPDFSKGLSTSLKVGLSALPDDCRRRAGAAGRHARRRCAADRPPDRRLRPGRRPRHLHGHAPRQGAAIRCCGRGAFSRKSRRLKAMLALAT